MKTGVRGPAAGVWIRHNSDRMNWYSKCGDRSLLRIAGAGACVACVWAAVCEVSPPIVVAVLLLCVGGTHAHD
jgi:hypothetical protein